MTLQRLKRVIRAREHDDTGLRVRWRNLPFGARLRITGEMVSAKEMERRGARRSPSASEYAVRRG